MFAQKVQRCVLQETVMSSCGRKFALLIPLLFIGFGAQAFDNGQYDNVPSNIRAWFKSVRSARGIPCCDIADGHRTDYDMRANAYWVPIEGKWMQVPDEAVLRNTGNPTGDAVVWYSKYGDHVVIRCFAPGGGA
jgi:hypothetical protein